MDPAVWPGVARVPRVSGLRTAVARTLLRRALGRLPLRVRWGGEPAVGKGPLLWVRKPDAFHRRIGAGGLIGFGESYMAGEWEADDLVGVLTVLAAGVDELVPAPLRRLRGLWVRRRPEDQRNTVAGSRENIRRHYDLSNELFALFLDPSLSYSSAVFGRLPGTAEDFEAAQHRKIDRLLDLAGVGPGTRLLEIGTGWGELAIRAARRGAVVRSVTLSAEQRELALRRVREAGQADRVTVELCDYRQVTGAYDAVVSVEMIEAVGADYWPVYFRTLRERLAPGGRVALQAITMPHDRMLATARTHTWISEYIFPGGLIPSPEAVRREAGRAGLRITADDGYGAHYAETLRLWRERFTGRAAEVAALGFDAVFRRMWELYLAYSEAGFRARYLDVRQLALSAADLGAATVPRARAAGAVPAVRAAGGSGKENAR
ncbi:cyclopropane-fatty-acyl-phospholipid synthase family protein [Streptomyces sp. LP05-1]|uniref:Cyclopropane-fatty-acyl-phospholipid synthase family protein n=1 Tax=Streptomyces pyxinae TaxID=2970734 RepID=A0ABT2CK41_9ACTN|nr:cyclopropane-fatty-acyl-phospholipid synthase family protein [Streptomyces sp. LP05-1]MCS0637788.1 cyclopropane-fatty-acyl-phospholipid synthase family protein [Streptomyces sp. LP05-1]